MEALRGVAYTFKVINEDTTAITKTWANSRLQGPDSVLTMLKFLERKLSGRKIKTFRPPLCQLEPHREILEVFIDDVSFWRKNALYLKKNKNRELMRPIQDPDPVLFQAAKSSVKESLVLR